MSSPNLFIIESLTLDDEDNERFEGRMLSHVLNLSERQSTYYYIRTRQELVHVLDIFEASKYRYLHLSCHGDESALATTLDEIPLGKLGEMVAQKLELFSKVVDWRNEKGGVSFRVVS